MLNNYFSVFHHSCLVNIIRLVLLQDLLDTICDNIAKTQHTRHWLNVQFIKPLQNVQKTSHLITFLLPDVNIPYAVMNTVK